ncbi:type II/IV secretion system ATPase subunit [Haloprofundus halobius]|uniref:type II/IV secretion system ATPase subunit n=1 Tax=Haloprofundus halobius TaxID=2876194 RepID=UPI001CC90B40|nr:type II/IV secretion system ATPase subunit [Haloprofundus halobius]
MSDESISSAGPTTPLDALRRRASRTLELLRGVDVAVRPLRPASDGPLASFDPPNGHEEVDRYWVSAPYAYVVVTYAAAENAHRYHTVEPDLDAFERALLRRTSSDIREPLLFGDDPVSPADSGDATLEDDPLADALAGLLESYGVSPGAESFHTLLYYLHRDFRGFGRIDPLLSDPRIEDLSCDGYGVPIFAYHNEYADIATDIRFERDELDDFVVRLAQQSGRHISVGDPIVETTLPDGSRAELALGEEVTPRGSAFTIRQYAEEPFTPVDLVEFGTFSVEQMAYLWLCIEHNKSLVFAGGTASGKTTSMNAVSMFIPPRAKVLSIEDTRELALHHDNWLSGVTRERRQEGADVDMYDLLRSALRHRPEYILVGEVRGREAVTLFQAMNTGHTTFSTMHADSIETVINRLENEPIDVPRAMVQSLDILSIQTLTRFDGERVRRTKIIGELGGIDQRTGELDYSSSFSWNPGRDEFTRHDSDLLDEIQAERGWDRSTLLRELNRRKRFLDVLCERGISDFRRFTALVDQYYADPEAALSRVGLDEDDGGGRGGSSDGDDGDDDAGDDGGDDAGDDAGDHPAEAATDGARR